MRCRKIVLNRNGESQMNIKLFALATILTSAAAFAQSEPGSTQKVAPDPITGDWLWMGDMLVSIDPDGKATNRSGGVSGTWKFLQNKEVERKYEITWNAPDRIYIDRLTLSRDGKKLDGKNQIGLRVSAKRVPIDR
jgi:hypothetical protein